MNGRGVHFAVLAVVEGAITAVAPHAVGLGYLMYALGKDGHVQVARKANGGPEGVPG